MKPEQLRINVPSAPDAIGRWDVDHEISAYRRSMGDDAFERQRKLAENAKECTCGQQAEADAAALKDARRPKKLFGWEHKPGCNSFTRRNPRLVVRISDAEVLARYEDSVREATTETEES